MKTDSCPKCRGFLWKDEDSVSCVNCGWEKVRTPKNIDDEMDIGFRAARLQSIPIRNDRNGLRVPTEL